MTSRLRLPRMARGVLRSWQLCCREPPAKAAVAAMHSMPPLSSRMGPSKFEFHSPLPLSYSAPGRREQRRQMFVQTQSTPNPSSLMFLPGRPVMTKGSADFANARSAAASPLARTLFRIDGVVRVFFGSDFVTVTKSEGADWGVLKPDIFAAIMDFYSSGQQLMIEVAPSSLDTAIQEDDDEIVAMIKELIETRIRPAVQDDGGDIEFDSFDPEIGIVTLRMQGACKGCPSSAITLKSGIENMLMHYVPEVKGVREAPDEGEDEDEEGHTDAEFDNGEINTNLGKI